MSMLAQSCNCFRQIHETTVTKIDTVYESDILYYKIDDETVVVNGDTLKMLWSINSDIDTVVVNDYNNDEFIEDFFLGEEIEVNTPTFIKTKIISDTVTADVEFAFARSYIFHNKIRLELQQKDTLISIMKDSLRTIINNKETVIKERETDAKRMEKKFKRWRVISLSLIGFILLLYIIVKFIFPLYKSNN